MHSRKKNLIQMKVIIFTAILMIFSSFPVYAEAEFTDTSPRYKEAVDFLIESRYAEGFSGTQFGTDQEIKRGDAAVILANALSIEGEAGKPSEFKDVPSRAINVINGLKAAGIVKGKSTSSFGFDDSLTRGEVALMLAGAAAYDLSGDTEKVKFSDVNDRYIKAVAGMVEQGITVGKTTARFDTAASITRGEFAIFIYKAEQLDKKKLESQEAAEFIRMINISQDKDQMDYGEELTLQLIDEEENLKYTTSWSASGGELTVEKDGKHAKWQPSLNLDGEYKLTVKIETTLSSGKVLSFVKETFVTVSKRNQASFPAPALVPYQADINFDQAAYNSGEEVTIKGVLSDRKGRAVIGREVSLENIRTTTDKNGEFVLSFLAIDEDEHYQLHSKDAVLKVKIADGQLAESFQVAVNTEQIDYQPNVVGLSSEAAGEMIEFIHGEKAVFVGAPKQIVELKAGDIFVTAPTEEFPLGAFGKVSAVEAGLNQTTVLLNEPELTEVFSKLELEGTTALQVENIVPSEGVEVFAESDLPSSDVRLASVDVDVDGDKIIFSIEKELLNVEEGWKYQGKAIEADITGQAKVGANGSLTLQNTAIDYDLSLLEGGGELTFYNEQVISLGINADINGSGEIRTRLGEIFIPIQGPIGVTGSLWSVVGIDGEISFDITYNQTSELELGAEVYGSHADGKGRFEIVKKEFTTTALGKATAKIGFKPNLFLSIYTEDLIGLDNEFGLSSNLAFTIEHIGTEDKRVCKVSEEKMYADFYGKVEGVDWTIELYKWEHSLGKTNTCPVPAEFLVSPEDDYVEKGQEFQLEVRGTTEEGEEHDYAPQKEGTSYVSSDPKTAIVDKNGRVTISETAQVGRQFTITVSNSGKKAIASFKVIEIEKIELTPQEIKLPAGSKQLVAVDAIMTNGEKLRMNDEKLPVIFSVENEEIARVSSEGTVIVPESNFIGSTTILTATYKNFEDTATIEVIRPPGEEPGAELSIIPTPAAAAGYNHSIQVRDDGTVWTWGSNENGKLGTGSTTNSLEPVQVAGLPKIKAVTAGKEHSLALAEDGTVWAWGDNSSGQLGTDTNDSSLTPVQVTGIENALSIAAASNTSYAIMTDGSVKAWGSGNQGLLGNGSEANSNVPVEVSGLTGIVSLDAALNYFNEGHVIALKKDGTVWTWGNGYFGALGSGPHLNDVWDQDATTPIQVVDVDSTGFLTDIVRVQAGDTHSLALGRDGSVYGWGNGWGEEVVDGINHPVQKRNEDGSPFQGVTEIAAGGHQENNVLKADGSIWTWKANKTPTPLAQLESVIQLSTGGYHSFALTKDGSVWGWGWNDDGQLGDGTTNWAWGDSSYTKAK